MQLLEEIAKKDPHLSKLLLSPKSIHESAFKTEKIASRTNRDIKNSTQDASHHIHFTTIHKSNNHAS